MTLTHLFWIPLGAGVGFLASFIFGDLLTLPLDLYYLIYFVIIGGFFATYVQSSGVDVRRLASHRIGWAVLLGIVVGVVMVINVVGRPETERFSGGMLAWAIFWRGLVYGAVDGLLLFTFPWIVARRAFGTGTASAGRKILASVTAFVSILVITTTYHLGYADFRSSKIVQPNIGSAIAAVPTLISANPVASPITHVFLHVAAVVHSPYTDLFLPPHRDPKSAPTPAPEEHDNVGDVP
jgi:hypothetical protein